MTRTPRPTPTAGDLAPRVPRPPRAGDLERFVARPPSGGIALTSGEAAVVRAPRGRAQRRFAGRGR